VYEPAPFAEIVEDFPKQIDDGLAIVTIVGIVFTIIETFVLGLSHPLVCETYRSPALTGVYAAVVATTLEPLYHLIPKPEAVIVGNTSPLQIEVFGLSTDGAEMPQLETVNRTITAPLSQPFTIFVTKNLKTFGVAEL
jgi:hypothetical protein